MKLLDILKNLEKQLGRHVAHLVERLGLVIDPQPFLGESLVLPPDRREVRLDTAPPYWRDVELTERDIVEAATELVEEFARRHGPGRVWCLAGLPLVHIVNDDGQYVRLDGRVRVRRLAAHEAAATPRATAIRTPVGDIAVRADPTLKPGEIAFKQPAVRESREEALAQLDQALKDYKPSREMQWYIGVDAAHPDSESTVLTVAHVDPERGIVTMESAPAAKYPAHRFTLTREQLDASVSRGLIEAMRRETDEAMSRIADNLHRAAVPSYWPPPPPPREYIGDWSTDPLDVEYDGVKLRDLVATYEAAQREDWAATRTRKRWTPAQRSAVSDHVRPNCAPRSRRRPNVIATRSASTWRTDHDRRTRDARLRSPTATELHRAPALRRGAPGHAAHPRAAEAPRRGRPPTGKGWRGTRRSAALPALRTASSRAS